MAIAIMFVVALAWCAWLAWDAAQECRKIDRKCAARSISDCLEVR
jgi:hypothetical protein